MIEDDNLGLGDYEDTHAEEWTPAEDDGDDDLQAQVEEATDKVPLGSKHDDDFKTGHEWKPDFDIVERRSRNSDYEAKAGRVRTGGEKEVDLSRVNLDAGGSAHGDGGGDWDGNISTRKSHSCQDGTGFQHDTRGSVAMTGRTEGVSEELHEEIRGAGLNLGVASVDIFRVGYVIASSAYIQNKERWRQAPDECKRYTYAKRKWKRRRRDWEKVRADSIQRQSSKIYKGFLKSRTETEPAWIYFDPAEIERMNTIDGNSAYQMAERWREGQDQKAMDALVVKYAALVDGGVQAESIRARWRRNKAQKILAESVFVIDLLACGCVSSLGFDKGDLLAEHGDELVPMDAACSEQERREFLIEASHDFFKAGALFPLYVWESLNPILEEIVQILNEQGIDLTAPEPEIDWSRV